SCALSGSALVEWRNEILTDGSFTDVCFLLNNQKWVFQNVHPRCARSGLPSSSAAASTLLASVAHP
ncbi:hypothetical protein, partial [Microbacterium aurum]